MIKLYDVNIMNAFLEGTLNVLKTMCGSDPLPGKPFLKENKKSTGDVSGCIALTGDDRHGVVVISFSRDAILLIVSRMLSEEKTWIDKEVKDAVGELTNMIAGDSRKNLAAHGLNFQAGIPMVIVGSDYEIYTDVSKKAPVFSIPFKLDKDHPFFVDFAFELGKERAGFTYSGRNSA